MSNAAIEAVRRNLVERFGQVGAAAYSDETLAVIIAAVLDHMPREAIKKELCLLSPICEGYGCGRCDKMTDAALSAARAALLPGDA